MRHPDVFQSIRCFFRLSIFGAICFLLSACSTSDNIAFPTGQLGDAQPQTEPLRFSAEKRLTWDTVKTGGTMPVVEKLDINTLPSEPIQSPLIQTVPTIGTGLKTAAYRYDDVPGQRLHMEELPDVPLLFTTKALILTDKQKIKPAEKENAPLSIHNLGVAQGFPSQFASAIYKDKTGMLWLGSSDGLYRYDGTYLETVVKGPFQSAIAGITEDDDGNIWYVQYSGVRMADMNRSVLMPYGGVGMVDLHRSVLNYSTQISSLTNNLGHMLKDSRGNLWLYDQNQHGAVVINPGKHTYKVLHHNNGLQDSTAFYFLEDDRHRIWMTTFLHGAYMIDPAAGIIKAFDEGQPFQGKALSVAAKDAKGSIWLIGVHGEVYEMNEKDGYIRQHTQGDTLIKFVYSACFDGKDRLWMTTENGLRRYDISTGELKRIHLTEQADFDVVYALVYSGNGQLWAGTQQGVSLMAQYGELVHYLPGKSIICTMEDKDERLWIGTSEGVKIIDRKQGIIRSLVFKGRPGSNFIQSFQKLPDGITVASNGGIAIIRFAEKTITYLNRKQGLASDTVYNASRDKAGNTWLAGPANGINLLTAGNGAILHTNRKNGLSDINIQDIKQDKNGLVWIATRTGGVDVYNPTTGTVKYLNNLPGLHDTCNRMLLADDYGSVWIGTDKGVYIANAGQQTITAIDTRHGLANDKVVSLLPYKGSVVVGTITGSSLIAAPVPAGSRQWKVAPLAGAQAMVRKNKNMWNVDAVTAGGKYLLGDMGVTVIDTIRPSDAPPPTLLSGLSIMTKQYHFVSKHDFRESDTLLAKDSVYLKGQQPDLTGGAYAAGLQWDSVSGPYNMPAGLRIPFSQNYLQFHFARASLLAQDTVWYMYILEGIDRKWSGPTYNTLSENYLNLPPGDYILKVSSREGAGEWSAPTSYPFTITPPWYRTGWAYALFGLAALALLRGYIVYRSGKLKRENKLLEEKVAERTEELNKSLERLKQTQVQLVQSEKMASLGELTAGIAHEIQNPLNFVNNFSEVNRELVEELEQELEKGDWEEAKAIAADIRENNGKINHHGKRADAIVKGMLEHSRSNSGKKEVADINKLVDEYLRLAYHGLRAKDKNFNAKLETHFDAEMSKIEVLPQELGRVLLNLFSNAFYAVNERKKQLNGTFEPLVSVSTNKLDGKVEIVIKDNGTGMPQKVLEKIYQPFFTTKPTGQGTGLGLSLSYDIITKGHGGELQVESQEGEGTAFRILLPMVKS
jgi:signal transduction histidine kinase/ligand-binding sensor domain-containing protein